MKECGLEYKDLHGRPGVYGIHKKMQKKKIAFGGQPVRLQVHRLQEVECYAVLDLVHSI